MARKISPENSAFASSALDAIEHLRAGNRRFVRGIRERRRPDDPAGYGTLAIDHKPVAIVLGCSDARVPAEIIFDQGIGDLFVIRVAGNVVASSQIGSVEYAAERYGIRLVVVLGHSNCGAISATLEELERPLENRSPNLRSIVDRIRPSIEPLLQQDFGNDPAQLFHAAIRANITASAKHLRRNSAILRHMIRSKGLLVVGAEYSLETGIVQFFEGMPSVEADSSDLPNDAKT